jgi:hypothetical protein
VGSCVHADCFSGCCRLAYIWLHVILSLLELKSLQQTVSHRPLWVCFMMRFLTSRAILLDLVLIYTVASGVVMACIKSSSALLTCLDCLDYI